MKKYTVIALVCHSDRTNKTYVSGDVVDDTCFHVDHAASLAKEGFLKVKAEDELQAQENPTAVAFVIPPVFTSKDVVKDKPVKTTGKK